MRKYGPMSTENFYRDLPSLEQFCSLMTMTDKFVSLPDDWSIVITDVVGSTKAIEAGHYKDVNVIGACSIIAVLNIAGYIEIPFVFGGDGASLLLPPSLLDSAKQVLIATRKLAREQFGLELRIGVVPVVSVKAAQYDIQVAKVKISEKYYQAMFTGGGLTYAEQLIKHPATSETYAVKNTGIDIQADFSGLVCPWQDIPSQDGQIVSLIVKATGNNSIENHKVYQEFSDFLVNLYHGDINLHPISPENLAFSFSDRALFPAAKAHAGFSKLRWNLWHLWKLKLWNLMKLILINFKVELGNENFGEVKHQVVADTDYRKLDDLLRMVISANCEQIEQLNSYLEKHYIEGQLVYGLHISDRALMTCFVAEREGRHIGFLDGADGGYALAAKAMKERMKFGFKLAGFSG